MFTKTELKRILQLVQAAAPSRELATIGAKITEELEYGRTRGSDLFLCDDERVALTQELMLLTG